MLVIMVTDKWGVGRGRVKKNLIASAIRSLNQGASRGTQRKRKKNLVWTQSLSTSLHMLAMIASVSQNKDVVRIS